MIDIGLIKLALIGVVALVVIGPEKLPTVARMVGSLFSRAMRYINDVKSEVSREIELEELFKMRQDVQEVADDFKHSISQSVSDIKSSLGAAWGDSTDSGSNDSDYPADRLRVEQLAVKARSFRKKKLARTSAIPSWYKKQNGCRASLLSGAARVAKYRPVQGKVSGSFFS